VITCELKEHTNQLLRIAYQYKNSKEQWIATRLVQQNLFLAIQPINAQPRAKRKSFKRKAKADQRNHNMRNKQKPENKPLHLLTIDEAEILKKVVLHSVATARASIVCQT